MRANEEPREALESERVAIGIDVGGTKTAAGLVTETGRILRREAIATNPTRGGQLVLDEVVELAQALRDEAERMGRPATALGMGVCELVGTNGAVVSSHTVKWRGLPVRKRLAKVLPAWIEADSRAAALCEARLGAGHDVPAFVYVTIGTGIGCALVLGGMPYRGAQGGTGTMATSPYTTLCSACGELSSAALEDIASGPALVRRYNEDAGAALESAEQVLEAVSRDDERARRVVHSAAECLGAAVGHLVNVFDPYAIVTGGGIGSTDGPYWRDLESATRRHIWSDSQRSVPIVRARFGDDAGLVGAALYALERC